MQIPAAHDGESESPSAGDRSAERDAKENAKPAAKPTDSKPAGPPAYPTSSKKGPQNWDKVADEEVEEPSNADDFFRQLYSNATPEMQRAMMKSFTESNGTALSTDWNDVKSRTVETIPPDGVEAKKWNS